MSQKDSGHFLSGVPKDCFNSGNPCQMQAGCVQHGAGEAGDRAVLEKTTTKPIVVTHPDDLDAQQPEQTTVAVAQIVG
jgi:hypothetical protein